MAEVDQEKIQEQAPQAEEKVIAADDDQRPMYNKIQMADVVKREKQKAHEKALELGKRMAMEEMQQQQAAQQQAAQQPMQQQPQQQQSNSMGGMSQMSPEQIRQMIAEQTQSALNAHNQQQVANHQAQGFVQKMEAAELKYPGMRAKLDKIDWTHMGPVIRLVDGASNAGEVMKELLDNPMKMGNLVALAHTQPHMAQDAVAELSNSIAQNQAALAQEKQAQEPLGTLTPSNVGSDTGKSGSVRDFKAKYRR